MDSVELDDDGANDGVALFKTVEFFRGTFFFSTSMELKTKGAGGGGAGREMMDSNTSLSSILTPKHFFALSAICFDRSDFACTCFSGKFLVHNCDLYDHVHDQRNNLFSGEIKCVVGGWK